MPINIFEKQKGVTVNWQLAISWSSYVHLLVKDYSFYSYFTIGLFAKEVALLSISIP